jgi:hypothetical protein
MATSSRGWRWAANTLKVFGAFAAAEVLFASKVPNSGAIKAAGFALVLGGIFAGIAFCAGSWGRSEGKQPNAALGAGQPPPSRQLMPGLAALFSLAGGLAIVVTLLALFALGVFVLPNSAWGWAPLMFGAAGLIAVVIWTRGR